MSDKVRAIVNPYMPPVDSAEQAPSNEPIESELIISGAATETEMIHTSLYTTLIERTLSFSSV